MLAFAAPFAAVIEPILLFWQLTVPPPEIFMPYILVLVAPPVIVTDPVPVAAPIVLPVLVPTFTSPPAIFIPVHDAAPEFDQEKF